MFWHCCSKFTRKFSTKPKSSLRYHFPTFSHDPKRVIFTFFLLAATARRLPQWLSQKPIFSFQAAQDQNTNMLSGGKSRPQPETWTRPLLPFFPRTSNRGKKRNHPQWADAHFFSLEKQKSQTFDLGLCLGVVVGWLWNSLRPQNQFCPATNANAFSSWKIFLRRTLFRECIVCFAEKYTKRGVFEGTVNVFLSHDCGVG